MIRLSCRKAVTNNNNYFFVFFKCITVIEDPIMTFEQDALDTVVKKSALIITVARLIKPVNKTSLFQCHPMQQILRLPGGGRGDSKENSLFCLNCMQKKKKKIHIVLLQNAFFFSFFFWRISSISSLAAVFIHSTFTTQECEVRDRPTIEPLFICDRSGI